MERAEQIWLQLSSAEKAMVLRGEPVPGLSASDLTLLRQWASSRTSEITTAEPFDLSAWSSEQRRFSSRVPKGAGIPSEEFSPEGRLSAVRDAQTGLVETNQVLDITGLNKQFVDDINNQVSDLEKQRDSLQENVASIAAKGIDPDAEHADYYTYLEYFVGVLNEAGATVNGRSVTVQDLIADDSPIRLSSFQYGNFVVEGTRTYKGGIELLDELADADYMMHPGAYFYSDPSQSSKVLKEIADNIEDYSNIEALLPEYKDELAAVDAELSLLVRTRTNLNRSLGYDEKGNRVATSDEKKLSTALASLAELDDIADFRYLASPLETLRQEIAPQLPSISVSENPELSAVLRNQTSVSADAQRDLGQATTQFQGPPSGFEAQMSSTTAPTQSADDQRAQFMAATAQRPSRPSSQVNPLDYYNRDNPFAVEEKSSFEDEVNAAVEERLAELGIDLGGDGGGGDGGGGVPSLTPTAAADMSEVQRLLIERFGGITFFLDKYSQELQVGVTANGSPVPADDPSAVRVMNVVDMMVEYGIVDPNQILKVVQQTSWYQTTDNAMRRHDALMANMTDLEKKEYFDPVLDQLRDEAVFLGVDLSDELAMQMANDILYMGESDDIDFIRQTLVTQGKYDLAQVEASSFAAISDSLVSLSKSYYTPIGDADASSLAQSIYFGNQTAEGIEQMFKEQAAAKYPMLANALAANITPEQYFAPYKYELERILGRPNIDLYEEFPDVVSYMAENGEMRPMTLNEVRRYARGLPEWQESPQGIDSAYALTFAIGEVFGEVA